MRKTVLLILTVLLLSTMSVSAVGISAIGGAFSFSTSEIEAAIPGGALSIKLDSIDPILGFGVRVDEDSFHMGVTADWWVYKEPLVDAINLYLGPGGYVNLAVNGSTSVDLGLRIPVGLQMFPIDPLELFIELAPKVGIGFPIQFPTWGLQGALGFRFWF